jgi:DNA-binding NtrC family response regulator
MAKILVVDDEMGIRELLSEILDDEGHEVLLAEHAAAARPLYANHAIDLVLLDIWMPDTDGMSLLREWTGAAPLRCPVMMMSGHASIDTAVEAQNLGAVAFLEKPITMHKLLAEVHKALHRAAHATPALAIELVDTDATTLIAVPPQAETLRAAPAPLAPPIAPPAHLSPSHEALSRVNLDTGLREYREQVERIYFNYIIEREQWAMTRIAEQAGLERTHLYRKLKQLNIEINRKAKT